MNVLILMGSPRLQGNTAELCKPFMEELKERGVAVRYVTLADKKINPCRGCYVCQDQQGVYGCSQYDEMDAVVADILWADCIVLATPIYAWYCAAPMKNVLDRHYGLNKFYGSAEGSLWAGKQVAILATHGYDGAYATDPFEMGVQRLCKHSGLEYLGLYSVQDTDNLASFRTEEAIAGAKNFARKLVK
jgi:multimeric flavodoxin WrbA